MEMRTSQLMFLKQPLKAKPLLQRPEIKTCSTCSPGSLGSDQPNPLPGSCFYYSVSDTAVEEMISSHILLSPKPVQTSRSISHHQVALSVITQEIPGCGFPLSSVS